MSDFKLDKANEGDLLPSINLDPVEHMDLVRYAGASGDFNPIHTDPAKAVEFGLDGTIAHGMYVMGLLSRVVTNIANPSQIKSYGVKFRGMTSPGETLVLGGKVKKIKDVENERIVILYVDARNNEGEIKVSGEAVYSLG
jgi:acyl dehydratase